MSSKLSVTRRRFVRPSSPSGALGRRRSKRRFPLAMLEATLEDRTLLSIPGVSVQGGVLTILGDQQSVGQDDSVTLEIDSVNPLMIDVTLNGVEESLPLFGLNPINQILVDGEGGSNSLTVDSTNGAINPPIQYQGSTATNSLTLTGGTATSETIAAGALAGSGTATLAFALTTETVQFQDLGSAIADDVTSPLEVDGTPGNDVFSYIEGATASLGLISANNTDLVSFTNKSSLTIDTGSGTDVVDVDNPRTPTGLASIVVNGGAGAAGDTLVVHDAPLVPDTIFVTPNGAGAGVIDDLSQATSSVLAPEITYSNISGITAKAVAGLGDQIQYNGTSGDDTFEIIPGASLNSGTIIGSGGPAAAYAFTPVTYYQYSGTTSGVFADSGFGSGVSGGTDTVIVDGTSANDTFTLANAPFTFIPEVAINTGTGSRTPVFFDPSGGVSNVVFRGLGGSDTYVTNFAIINAFPGVGIDIEGNGKDTLDYTSTIFANTNVDVNTATITSTLANPVTVHGITTFNINDLGGSASVTGTGGTQSETFIPTGANSAVVTLPVVDTIFSFAYVFLGFTLNPISGTLTVEGSTGDDLIDLAGVTDTTATINVDGLLTANVDTSSSLAVVIASGTGNDTLVVDSTTNPFTSPVTFASGGGQDQLELTGGTATSDVYTAYATTSQSVLDFTGGTETITVVNIYGILDNVTLPAAAVGSLPLFDVIGTASNSTINYQVGLLAATDGLITVDTNVPLEFTNKGDLGIEGGPGNDTININNASTPTGLTDIGVDGGSGVDKLVINAFGSAGVVSVPSVISITGQVPVGYTNIEAIQILNAPVPPITTVPILEFLGNAGVPIVNAIVGAFFQSPVGYPAAPASSFVASINWGDGTPATPGTIVASATGGYAVLGSHTYALAKTYSVVVSIKDNGSNPTLTVAGVPISIQEPGSTTTTALSPTPGIIAQSPLFVVGQPITGTAGVPIPAGTVVGTFTDSGGALPVADYAATITLNTGVGTPTAVPATIVLAPGSTSNFLVETPAAVTLPSVGTYGIQVGVARLTSTPPQTSGANTTVTINPVPVIDYPITAQGVGTIGGQEDTPLVLGTVLATFSYSNPTGFPGVFVGTISWGDGTSSAFTSANLAHVGASHAGQVDELLISAALNHTYAATGTYQVVVTITNVLGSAALAIDEVNVVDAPLTVVGVSTTAASGVPFSGEVATFTDAAANGVVGAFSSTITWADGTTTAGIITAGTAGGFIVSGTHVFLSPGTYPASVTVIDRHGASDTTTSYFTVSAGVLTAGPVTGNVVTAAKPFTGTFGEFTDSDPLATPSDFAATINWGDGTLGTGTVSENSLGVFSITGTHTYANPSLSTVIPVTFNVHDTAVTGGASLTSVHGANVVVADAPLSLFQGATITSLQGLSTGLVTLGTFTSTNPTAKASQFGAVIYWGDGTTSGGTVTSIGATPGGETFSVKGTHTYLAVGNSPITIRVTHAGGSEVVGQANDIVSAAPLGSSAPVISATGGVSVTATVANFTDANPTSFSPTAYAATIDWGDGSPKSAGTIVVNPAGGYSVVGTHTYSDVYGNGGTAAYSIQTVITDVGGAKTTAMGAALVSYVFTPMTGILDPSSDTGDSSTDGITNDSRPTFIGTAAPGAIIVVFAQSTASGSVPVPIAQTTALAGGQYTATPTSALADGSYIITATATDTLGNTIGSTTIFPATSPLLIDTVAPVVTNVYFNRVPGQVDVTFKDAGSGLDAASVTDAANYSLVKKNTPAGTYVITGITTSTPSSDGSENVVLTFNNGAQIRGGYYTFSILSGASGIQDVAGNDLDGEFFGTFPSGNGSSGSSFVATLDAIHHKVYAPGTVVGSSTGVTTSPPTIIPTANPELSVSSVTATSSKTVAAESLRSTILGTSNDVTTLATHDTALSQVSAKHVAKAARRLA